MFPVASPLLAHVLSGFFCRLIAGCSLYIISAHNLFCLFVFNQTWFVLCSFKILVGLGDYLLYLWSHQCRDGAWFIPLGARVSY